MSEKRENIDILLEKIDLMIEEVDTKIGKTKANAYGTDLRDTYAVVLRDEFNNLEGEYSALIRVKNEILEIIRGENDE